MTKMLPKPDLQPPDFALTGNPACPVCQARGFYNEYVPDRFGLDYIPIEVVCDCVFEEVWTAPDDFKEDSNATD
jgi:hypothetical protein